MRPGEPTLWGKPSLESRARCKELRLQGGQRRQVETASRWRSGGAGRAPAGERAPPAPGAAGGGRETMEGAPRRRLLGPFVLSSLPRFATRFFFFLKNLREDSLHFDFSTLYVCEAFLLYFPLTFLLSCPLPTRTPGSANAPFGNC